MDLTARATRKVRGYFQPENRIVGMIGDSYADPEPLDPDLYIYCKVGSGSVWRVTNPDPGHKRQVCRNMPWQKIKINPLIWTFSCIFII